MNAATTVFNSASVSTIVASIALLGGRDWASGANALGEHGRDHRKARGRTTIGPAAPVPKIRVTP